MKALLSFLTFAAVALSIQVVVFAVRGRYDIASFLLLLTNMVSSAAFEVHRQHKRGQAEQARNEQEKASKIDSLRPANDRKG